MLSTPIIDKASGFASLISDLKPCRISLSAFRAAVHRPSPREPQCQLGVDLADVVEVVGDRTANEVRGVVVQCIKDRPGEPFILGKVVQTHGPGQPRPGAFRSQASNIRVGILRPTNNGGPYIVLVGSDQFSHGKFAAQPGCETSKQFEGRIQIRVLPGDQGIRHRQRHPTRKVLRLQEARGQGVERWFDVIPKGCGDQRNALMDAPWTPGSPAPPART